MKPNEDLSGYVYNATVAASVYPWKEKEK